MTHAQPTQKRLIYVRFLNWFNEWRCHMFAFLNKLISLLVFVYVVSFGEFKSRSILNLGISAAGLGSCGKIAKARSWKVVVILHTQHILLRV